MKRERRGKREAGRKGRVAELGEGGREREKKKGKRKGGGQELRELGQQKRGVEKWK